MWSRSACCALVGTASIALSTELVATVAITIFLVFPSGTVCGGIWCAWPIILGDQIILALGAVIGWICTHFASCLTGRTLTTYICCPWRTSIHAPGFIFEVVGRTLFTGCGCLAHIASCGTSLALIWESIVGSRARRDTLSIVEDMSASTFLACWTCALKAIIITAGHACCAWRR